MSFIVTKTIATALFSSIIYYYNSLCHNVALKDILKWELPGLLVSLTPLPLIMSLQEPVYLHSRLTTTASQRTNSNVYNCNCLSIRSCLTHFVLVRMYVCMYVCMHVCTYVSLYVCICVCYATPPICFAYRAPNVQGFIYDPRSGRSSFILSNFTPLLSVLRTIELPL